MKKTNIIVAAALIASFGLVGCGGGGSGSDGSSTATVNGTAVDPELIGATVCLDINSNGECEINEPSIKTNMDGNYTLTVSTDQMVEGATLLVQGGYDRVTKMPFIGTMTAMVDEANLTAQMITPLTTLVYERAMAVPETMEEAQVEVAELLGLTVEELQENMLALTDKAALQAALLMQQAAELAADANDTRVFYRAMAEEMSAQYNNQFSGLMAAVADSNLSGVEQLRVQYFAQAMDAMNTAWSVDDSNELYAMSTEKMQEMVALMDTPNPLDIASLMSSFMISSDEMEAFITEHLLEAAGIVQPIIDKVKQTIVDNADITVDTSFGMMITIIDQLKTDGYITQTQYDEMFNKLNAMKIAFEA